MATIPSTPPRKSRIQTPDAPMFGPGIERTREKKEKKEKQRAAAQPPATTSRAKSHGQSVSFALSPPGSPNAPPSPGPFARPEKGKYSLNKSTDPFAGPSSSSSSRFKKFKPPPTSQKMKNPFAPEEAHAAAEEKEESSTATNAAAGMLPTPAKTPSRKRKYHTSTEPEIEGDSTARVLFSESITKPKAAAPLSAAGNITLESILGEGSSRTPASSTRKKAAHRAPSDLSRGDLGRDLFGVPEEIGAPRGLGAGANIEIYTDSNARIPEYDPSPDNPFIDHDDEPEAAVAPVELNEKAKKIKKKFEKSKKEFDSLKAGRDDGMVYTFRGMKVFRKFEDDNDEVLGHSIQPRVLFPSARRTRATKPRVLEEEEEVEQQNKHEAASQSPLATQSDTEEDGKQDSSTDVDDDNNCGEEKEESGPFTSRLKASRFTTPPPAAPATTSKSKGAVSSEQNGGSRKSRKIDVRKEHEDKEDKDKDGKHDDDEHEQHEEEDDHAYDEKKMKKHEHIENNNKRQKEGKDQEKKEKNNEEEDDDHHHHRDDDIFSASKPPRSASVAPSVSSSVASSSNIMSSFGRRPRITKSVSNLSSSCEISKSYKFSTTTTTTTSTTTNTTTIANTANVGSGMGAGLRRSKRLASVEPEAIPIEEIGKALLKVRGAAAGSAKRGRSPDGALEHTERWAHGVSGGIRKRYKN
ncbi:hypothetical protein DFH27DRAFT_551607 [Peziza echinospora]|nr:hypothetical protein DFH27DRAFT_551607 [Peziza echinospora]